jgi:single-strand DNA-binding protein
MKTPRQLAGKSINLQLNYFKTLFMIKMQVIGNLGKDCITNTVNGKSVMNFTVAHTEKFKNNQGQQQDKTIWVDCAYWSDRTAVAPYLKKGTQVYVEGSPEVKTYAKNDGTQGFSLSLRVSSVQLLGSKGDSNSSGGSDYNTGGNTGGNNYNQGSNNNYGSQGASNVQANSEISEPVDDLPF